MGDRVELLPGTRLRFEVARGGGLVDAASQLLDPLLVLPARVSSITVPA